MAEKKAAQAVQQMSKAQQGVERARRQAERGELVDSLGRVVKPSQIAALSPKSLADQPAAKKREIQQAGAAASNALQAKRRTIKDIYNDLLQQPDDITGIEDQELAERAQQRAQQQGKAITVYDSIAIAMAAKAKAGDVKAAVFVRDSAGDKPADQVELTAETMTDADRELLANVQKRLQNNDTTQK